MITVAIVDDHPIVRAGLRAILAAAADIKVVAEGTSGADALRLVALHRPDVLVLDVHLPDTNGVEITRRLRARGTSTAILILTVHDDRETVFGLLDAGATGYVLKDDALETLVAAVRAAARGECWLSPAVAGLVVHRSKGHQTGTLVNALVHHFKHLSGVSGPLRPGVVHRLDRDTSGVILVIKDDSVHEQIARQFEHRLVRKEYIAVCEGRFDLDGDLIDAPIGPDTRRRERMRVRQSAGKAAQTVYEVGERVGPFSVVRCFPRTGRTHQIRVHLRYVGHPIVADALYGRRDAIYASDLTGGEHPPEEEPLLGRQALHARRLTITHPVRGETMTFEAPLPADMAGLIEALRGTYGQAGRRGGA